MLTLRLLYGMPHREIAAELRISEHTVKAQLAKGMRRCADFLTERGLPHTRDGRVFEDAVAHSFYPIDLHVDGSIVPKHLAEGVVATIPLGALIPKSSKNLMVAGRCLSSDRPANSALRVQASCMAMGQAAGVTVALAARQGVTPKQVAIADVRRELTRHGAIVPKTA